MKAIKGRDVVSSAQPEPGIPTRAEGPLTVAEIEALRRTYAAGARGQLLVGLRRRERLLPLLLPARDTDEAVVSLLRENAEQLRRQGADGFIHVRRVTLRRPRTRAWMCLLVHHYIEEVEQQRAVSLTRPWIVCLGTPVMDSAANTLRRTISPVQPVGR